MTHKLPDMFSLLAILCLFGLAPLSAQQATPETMPLRVTIQAADGVTLVGDLYNAEMNVQTSAVLLMHMLGGQRGDWQPLIPALTVQGYRVLNVDLRGHGESQGSRNWLAAVSDVQAWLDWMHSQPAIQPDHLGIVGASIGSNLALIGCANDAQCVTAVALSPGLNYLGIGTRTPIANSYGTRSALLIASQNDRPSGGDVKTLVTLAAGEIGLQLYPGSVHGTNLLTSEHDSVIPLIVNWLDIHLK